MTTNTPYKNGPSAAASRTSAHPVDPQFLGRWSPRAYAEAPIDEAELLTMFEAARWAPSCFNTQPWRFLYARRDTPEWDRFLGLLIEFNQGWAKNASALVFIVSKTKTINPANGELVPVTYHAFDTGAAWGQLALQAHLDGWQAHAMAGFDGERARAALNIPDDYAVQVAVAIGREGDASILPEKMAARELASAREPLSALAFAGGFPAAQ